MIDYALRRRFSFVEMESAFASESFKEYQASLTSPTFDNIINLIIKLNDDNMYQIFTYVKNYDKSNTGNVSGILLYAKTDETVLPDEKPFKIGGNTFSVKTLDLNTEFSEISNRLNEIIKFIQQKSDCDKMYPQLITYRMLTSSYGNEKFTQGGNNNAKGENGI